MRDIIKQLLKKYSGIFKDLSWTFVAQTVGNLLRFLLVFIVVRCYTQEEFGLWASITSIAAVIVTGDFGLTNVLRNIASRGLAHGNDGDDNTKEAWFSAFIFMVLFAIFGVVLLYFIKDYEVFANLFKTDNEQLKSLGNGVMLLVIAIFLFGLPLGMVGGMFLSYGEVKEGSIFSLISGVLTFFVVVILSLVHARIDIVSIVYFLCPVLVNVVANVYFLHKRKWRSFNYSPRKIGEQVKKMLPTGMCFLGVDFSRNLIPSVLTIYSGAMLGLSFAANINVATKIYSFFMSVMVSLLNPIWARLSRFYYSGDKVKCRKMMKVNLMSIVGGAAVVILSVTLFRDVLVRIIAGKGYDADMVVFILVGACLFGRTIFDSASLLLMSTNRLSVLLPGYLIFSLMALFLFPEIVISFSFNVMMVAMILCWFLFVVAIIYQTRYVLRDKKK